MLQLIIGSIIGYFISNINKNEKTIIKYSKQIEDTPDTYSNVIYTTTKIPIDNEIIIKYINENPHIIIYTIMNENDKITITPINNYIHVKPNNFTWYNEYIFDRDTFMNRFMKDNFFRKTTVVNTINKNADQIINNYLINRKINDYYTPTIKILNDDNIKYPTAPEIN